MSVPIRSSSECAILILNDALKPKSASLIDLRNSLCIFVKVGLSPSRLMMRELGSPIKTLSGFKSL